MFYISEFYDGTEVISQTSLVGVNRQRKLRTFAILAMKPRGHLRIMSCWCPDCRVEKM